MPRLSGFLKWIHSHPRWSTAGLVAYAAAVTFPHENVQWLVNEIAIKISHPQLYYWSGVIGVIQAALLTAVVVWRLRRQGARGIMAAFWILTLGLIWCAWRFFTANNVELVHYPQYVPEGFVLMALTLSPAESLAWVAILGGLDEAYQYTFLSFWRPVPYDFNDVYMDLLGGAAGILLAMAFLHCQRRKDHDSKALWKRPGIVAVLSIVTSGILLWAMGLMQLFEDKARYHWFALSRFRAPAFWFQVVVNGPNKYHTLSPVEGPILILATIGLYALLDRWVRISTVESKRP